MSGCRWVASGLPRMLPRTREDARESDAGCQVGRSSIDVVTGRNGSIQGNGEA